MALAGLLILGTVGPAAGAEPPQARTASPANSTAPRLTEYKVPAGTALLLKLRTPLDSSTAAVDDQNGSGHFDRVKRKRRLDPTDIRGSRLNG
jgi:hypothetical protein